METFKKLRIEQQAVKVYVVFSGLYYTAYVGLLCLGIREEFSELISIACGYTLLCGAAWVFRLCWLSWAFILYSLLVRVCIIMYIADLWGDWLDVAHYTVFGIGAVLCGYFLCNIKQYFYDCGKQ